jgi:osmotically-inducible protein OsmY
VWSSGVRECRTGAAGAGSSGGLVTLSGAVSSWAAHDQAVAAAWSVPGVTQVDDRIRIESRR